MENLRTMLNDVSKVSERFGLRINMKKTEIMSNVHVAPIPVNIRDYMLEIVADYVYLGQTSS